LPSLRSIAADSNVLLSAVAKRAARRVFNAPGLAVVTTDVTLSEVYEYSTLFARRYRIPIDVFYETIEHLPLRLYDESEYRSHVDEARRYLEHRDPDDVPLAALALKLDVPIWSNDNDFRELPLPVYTTAALLRALGM
jgi:predicted nucleic acid-binding protein